MKTYSKLKHLLYSKVFIFLPENVMTFQKIFSHLDEISKHEYPKRNEKSNMQIFCGHN
jgi:hypothetical protein